MTALSDFDLYLFGQGTLRRAYHMLGAHPEEQGGRRGVRFAVWAPDASAVSVIGDFNGWQPGKNPMQPTGSSGIWQTFVPDLREGALYKYAIQPRWSQNWLQKADPYAFAAELRPNTASRVVSLDSYEWHDTDWLESRARENAAESPFAVYEVHLSSW